jgi:hypothetical protein
MPWLVLSSFSMDSTTLSESALWKISSCCSSISGSSMSASAMTSSSVSASEVASKNLSVNGAAFTVSS